MSRKFTFTALAVALGLVAGACSEQPAPTAAGEAFSPVSVEPMAVFTNGPDTPGIVVRFTTGYGLLFGDFDNQFLALYSWDDGLLGCTESTTLAPASIQDIFGGMGVFSQLFLAQASFVTVYDWTGFPTIDCALLTGATGRLLAQGNVQLEIFDNDVLGGRAFGGEGANAFGFNAAGRLTNVATGRPIGTRLHRTHLVLPDGTFRPNHVRWGPLLNPDPR
ncbi:MAG: hypothetical protein O7E49_04390 [Gemmatimonadetes bacterium]|nr:hypothetical protein [Gemmatimonadota bacterium]